MGQLLFQVHGGIHAAEPAPKNDYLRPSVGTHTTPLSVEDVCLIAETRGRGDAGTRGQMLGTLSLAASPRRPLAASSAQGTPGV